MATAGKILNIKVPKKLRAKIKHLPGDLQVHVWQALHGLAELSRAGNKLKRGDCYAIRVGKWRILYDIDWREGAVEVLDVDKRKVVYH